VRCLYATKLSSAGLSHAAQFLLEFVVAQVNIVAVLSTSQIWLTTDMQAEIVTDGKTAYPRDGIVYWYPFWRSDKVYTVFDQHRRTSVSDTKCIDD
jgi:hypothetical protein